MLNPFSKFGKSKGKRGEPLPEKHDGLPDSDVKAGLCPRCMKQSSFDVISTIPVTFDGGYIIEHSGSHIPTHSDQVSVLVCRHCRQGIVAVEEQYYEESSDSKFGGKIIRHRGIYWWPLPSVEKSEEIPESIVEAFSEAERALAANCPRAAAVMARRTIEAVTDNLGKTSGTLYKRLEILKNEGTLHPTIYDWASGIRILGNVGAHYDPLQSISRDEASELIAFVRELLKYVYEFPARLGKMKN